MSIHLGNVLVTISDKPLPKDNNSDGTLDYYTSDVKSASDYYSFGMQMPGRSLNTSTYRYGFNGKENDNEVKGEGNEQDYGMRIYDPRVGRFLSVDPLFKSYPELTPYQFASDRPIEGIDMDGLEFRSKAAEDAYYHRNPALSLPIPASPAHPVPLASIQPTNKDNTYKPNAQLAVVQTKQSEVEIAKADIFGKGWIGPKSIVEENVAAVKNKYYAAVGDNVASSPFGAAGYMIGGEKGSFYGAAVGDIAFSFAGVPGEGFLSKPGTVTPEVSVPHAEATIVKSFNDLVKNPKAIWGMSADQVERILGNGWVKEPLNSGVGWKFTSKDDGGFVSYTTGNSHHPSSTYYKINSGSAGKIKVVGSEYVPAKGDKSKIINAE